MTPHDPLHESPRTVPRAMIHTRAYARRWRAALKPVAQAAPVRTPSAVDALALREAGDEGFVRMLREAGL